MSVLLHKYYQSFWTQHFVNLICSSLCVSILVGMIWYAVAPGDNPLKAGDFAAFYTAGKLALEDPSSLYSINVQAALQESIFNTNGYHVFAYPPFVALFFEPFAMLDPLSAKLLYLVLLSFCVIGSVFLLTKESALPVTKFQLFSLLLLFFPLTIAISSGQNTAISLLLLISTLYFANHSRWILAGACLGLWNFKPQYSLIAFGIVFILSQSKTRLVLGYLLVSLAQLLLSIAIFGREIIFTWLNLLSTLGEMNNNSLGNISKMTSLHSLYRAASPCCPAISLVLVVALGFLLFETARRNRADYSIVGVIVAMLSPQTGFYDLALILPFVITRLGNLRSPFVWNYLFFCVVIYLGITIQSVFQFQILPFVVAIFISSLRYDLLRSQNYVVVE